MDIASIMVRVSVSTYNKNKNICVHTGNYAWGNTEVFEVGRRLWIIPDNGNVENADYAVDTCPNAVLKCVMKKVG